MTEALPPSGSAPAIILEGGVGSGKTDILPELIACGLELFVIGTEPRFSETLFDAAKRRKIDTSKLHIATVAPSTTPFAQLIQTATQVGAMTYESLAGIKLGPNKAIAGLKPFVKLLTILSNFTEDSGKQWGPVDQFGPDKALAIDSLSGINVMAKDLMSGGKPTLAQGEWGVAMDQEEQLLLKLCSDLKCPFVLTAHTEREIDETTGGGFNTVGALGKKLAPKIPRFFSEVILCKRDGSEYWWSTMAPGYDLKKRVLPLQDKITPSFKPIIEAWRARQALGDSK